MSKKIDPDTVKSNLKKLFIAALKNEIDFSIKDCFSCITIPEQELKNSIASPDCNFNNCLNIQKACIKKLDQHLATEYTHMILDNSKKLFNIKKNIDSLKNNLFILSPDIPLFNESDIMVQTENLIKETPLYLDETFINENIAFLNNIQNLINSFSELSAARAYQQIKKLQKDLPTELQQTINIDSSKSEHYQKLIAAHEDILESIESIYDDLVCLKYALSDTICKEIIFTLGFIDNIQLINEAPNLNEFLKRHTKLYQDIFRELPSYLQNNLAYITPEDLLPEFPQHLNTLIYSHLRTIIKFYQANPKPIQNIPFIYNGNLDRHLVTILLISEDSSLINLNQKLPYDFSNLKLLQAKLEITDADLSEIFNITPSAFSKRKGNYDIKTLLKLSYFYNFSYDFIHEKTTCPAYGKMTFFQNKTSSSEELCDLEYKIYPISYINSSKIGLLKCFGRYYTNLIKNYNMKQYVPLLQYISKLETIVDSIDLKKTSNLFPLIDATKKIFSIRNPEPDQIKVFIGLVTHLEKELNNCKPVNNSEKIKDHFQEIIQLLTEDMKNHKGGVLQPLLLETNTLRKDIETYFSGINQFLTELTPFCRTK